MSYGAGTIAVKRNGGKFVNPRKYAVGSIKDTFEKFPHLTNEIPAMGYSRKQIKDLEKTINRVPCDVVVDGTPANLKGLISVNKPMVEVDYELGDSAVKDFEKLLKRFK
jgi:predicted GTPase